MCITGCNRSSGGSGGSAASGSTTGTPTPCPNPCTIASLTVSTARANRARLRVGVAERVTLTASPGGSYTWSVAGGGTLSSTSGNPVVFTAGDRASSSTVTATNGSCSCSIVFAVVEPNGANQVQFGATLHDAGACSAGFRGITYLTPADVSFENIEVNEGTVNSTATGSFVTAGWHNLPHPAWPSWATVGGGSDATGSVVQGPNHDPSCTYYDYIHSGALPAGCAAGTFTWPIPWEFRVNGGTKKAFTTLTHHAVANGARKMTISKGGVSVSATEP
jgi:hypothetical protein